jgi:hypothetical protein
MHFVTNQEDLLRSILKQLGTCVFKKVIGMTA